VSGSVQKPPAGGLSNTAPSSLRRASKFPREFCFDGHSSRTPEEYPYSYDPYFLLGSKREVEGATSAYSDRMREWDREKYTAMMHGGGDYGWRKATLVDASEMLSAYWAKPVRAVAIAEGCNVSNGYPYWIVWWRDEAAPAKQPGEPQ
jgi:hypothetical protein